MNAPELKLRRQLRRERETNQHIPYEGHVTRHTVKLVANDYAQVLRIEGVSFETVDDEQLNLLHEKLNDLIRGIANPNVSIWHQLIRRKQNKYPEGDYQEGFAKDFTNRYMEKISGEVLMVNEIYLTIIYRPMTSTVGRVLSGFARKKNENAAKEDDEASLETLEHVVTEVMSGLTRYEPERLGMYEHKGILFSEALEFFGYLTNLEWNRVPVLQASARSYLSVSRPIFGTETLEVRRPCGSIYGAMLGYTGYPYKSPVGSYDGLLTEPYPFIMTQSFTFLTKGAAKYIVKTSKNRMINADDDALSQLDELDDLLDDLESNRVVMGDHHVSLFVYDTSVKKLERIIGELRSVIGGYGAVVAREDLAIEAAFWAMLPGNFKYRPRLSPITSRNFAAMTSMHNYPAGRITGNHWGDAVTLLVTEANTPLYFNIHASDPKDEGGDNKKDVGHTMILGPTGCGKTALVAAIIAFLQKFGLMSICFTKDKDLSILIRALGGKFLPLTKGMPTGCNPFQLDNTPANIQFWNELVCSLVSRPLTLKDRDEIKEAINWMKDMDVSKRRLGRLLDHMDKSNQDNVHYHLRQWCYARKPGEQDGLYAWVLDNETDTIAALLEKTRTNSIIGFDVTDFLDNAMIRMPLNMYLFHLVEKLVDGRRIGIFIAEFWKSLGDAAFSDFVENKLLTIRKKNGFVCLDSQSPSHALKHPKASALIEQTATKILFPNSEAKHDDYVNGLSLSEREFKLIKEEIGDGSRSFLVKQGKNSVVASLDLKGFDFELDVLSGKEDNIRLVDRLIEECGEDPAVWLPRFKKERGTA